MSSKVMAQRIDSCYCISIPKSKQCWLFCLKFASTKQLTKNLHLDSITAKKIVELPNRKSYQSLEKLQSDLPQKNSEQLSISIENSSVGNTINQQNNYNSGDVVNGSVTNNYYTEQPDESKALRDISKKIDEKEIKQVFAENDYNKATELISKVIDSFDTYQDFIVSQIFGRDL